MAQKFGALLRKAREDAGKSMGALARHLCVSVTFVSDVERNTRAPFTRDKIDEAAAFLSADPTALHEAAAESRGLFQLDASEVSKKKLEVGTALARSWAELTDSQMVAIQKVLEGKRKEDGK